MLIVAFDGLLFDTLEHRANAIVDALKHEGFRATADQVQALLPSRSIGEAVRAVVTAEFGGARTLSHNFDETSIDLAVLRAERTLSTWASSGATLNVKLAERIRRAASVTRMVVRADSRRRDVDELLRLTELDSLLAMTRCSDDAAPAHRSEAHTTTLERSYAQIVTRMAANRNLLGGPAGIGVALEPSPLARQVARDFGFQAPDDIDTYLIPGS